MSLSWRTVRLISSLLLVMMISSVTGCCWWRSGRRAYHPRHDCDDIEECAPRYGPSHVEYDNYTSDRGTYYPPAPPPAPRRRYAPEG